MKALSSLAAALALAGLSSVATANGSVVFTPVASEALVGDLVVVEVRGLGFTDNVIGGGFDLNFDPAVVSLSSVQVDNTTWGFATNMGTIDNTAGTLTAVWFNAFQPLPTGNFPIATLRFTALAPGVSPLNLLANAGFPFVSDQVELIAVDFGNLGSISVVPEPSTWASLALGLAVLPWLRRRMAPN
jgi:hypothetical protein